MASMNNWLGFSLSPQEIPSQVPQDHSTNHHHISSGDCFDFTPDSTILPSLNLPAGPFGMLEAFNRNNQSSQDWNLKEGSNTNYKNTTSSEMSMLMMGRASNNPNLEIQEPKLENFLGGHSFSDQNHKPNGGDYMYPNHHHHEPNNSSNTTTTSSTTNNGTVGLSMIKSWLRSNPTSQSSSDKLQNNINDGVVHHSYHHLHQQNQDNDVLGAHATISGSNMNNNGGNNQNLSLSVSTGSQSTSALPLLTGGRSDGDAGESSTSENKHPTSDNNHNISSNNNGGGGGLSGAIEPVPRKSIDTFGQRTSIYRGVTRHRWTGRYEAHLWDNSCRREGQTRKGRQVYLGGYDKEEKAARAYDLAALKYWGTTTTTNFPISNYEKEIEEMKHMTRQEYVASLRRKSSGFSRGASIYRGVTRHHQHGRWQARIGRVAGNKDLYLGTFSTQEEAAEAYDIAAIKFRGVNAVTNFEISRYNVKSILESSTLPIGGAAKRLKDAAEQAEMALGVVHQRTSHDHEHLTPHLTDGMSSYHAWPTIAFQQAQPLSIHYPYGSGGGHQQQRLWCKQENDSSDIAHHGGFQDFHQLQMGSTHNFLQPSVLHNLISLDSSSLEHSSGSSSVMYSNGGGHSGENSTYQGSNHGYGSSGSGYLLPMGTVLADHQEGGQNHQGNGFGGNGVKVFGYENMYDPYQTTRNLYYQSQQSSSSSSNMGTLKAAAAATAGIYDHHQGSSCNTWVPTAVPTLKARANNMAVCHGSSTFTVWNDT